MGRLYGPLIKETDEIAHRIAPTCKALVVYMSFSFFLFFFWLDFCLLHNCRMKFLIPWGQIGVRLRSFRNPIKAKTKGFETAVKVI